MNTPLDADAVLRDDALLDALSRGTLPPEHADDETARGLLAWRADLADERPHLAAGRRRPVLGISRRMSVAAAVGVTTAVSLGSIAAAGMAEPGSPFWAITKVVYTERAESIQAREDALATLRKARAAAEHHQPWLARQLLVQASREVDLIHSDTEHAAVLAELAAVRRKVEAMDEISAPVQVPSVISTPALPTSVPAPPGPPVMTPQRPSAAAPVTSLPPTHASPAALPRSPLPGSPAPLDTAPARDAAPEASTLG